MPWSSFFECWVLSQLFHPPLSLSLRLFSSSLLSAIRVVSSAFLRLLIFLLAILIPACVSSSLAFHMMYTAYKSNKQGDSVQPWHTPFPMWNQSVVPCPVLTVASYRFLRRQVRWSGIPISLRIFHSSPERERERLILQNFLRTVATWLHFINGYPSIMILVRHHSRAGLPRYPLQLTLYWGSGFLITRHLVLLCTSPETKWQIGGRCMWCNF